MVFVLDTLPKKALTLALAAAATLALAFPLWSHFRADSLARMGTREGLELALQLEPQNAELHNRYGRLLLFSPLGDSARAVAALEQAVALHPRNAFFWVDLALAREQAGDVAAAARAFDEARRAEPRTPAILWQQANFVIRRGQDDRAVAMISELLHSAPGYTHQAIPVFARLLDFGYAIDHLIPAHDAALGAVLDFLRREERLADAGRAWARILASGRPFPAGSIRPFLDWLIYSGEGRLAAQVWADAARRGWIPVDAEALSQPLYNAGFRQGLLNYGFDWRVQPHPDASVWIEGRGARPGQESLCVQLADGARGDYANVVHFVPVEPNQQYALQAALRSERLVSRTGAYLQLTAMSRLGRVSASTEMVVGTTAWKTVVARITTPADSSVAQIALIRPAPLPGEEPARGLVCVSAIEWKVLGPAQ